MQAPFVRYELREYQDAGCMQTKEMPIAIYLHSVTDGRMCNGCAIYPRCDALTKLRGGQRGSSSGATAETVRQEAQRRGLSLSEVRRQRAAGTDVS